MAEEVEAPVPGGETIRDVWAFNLEQEFRDLCDLAQSCQYVAMDTEYAGSLYYSGPNVDPRNAATNYSNRKESVETLKIIQLGLTLRLADGEIPANRCSTWQFNFKFDKEKDPGMQTAIELLENSGIDFPKHAVKGIEPHDFAFSLMMSGLVLQEHITWLVFQGASDFSYLLMMLTGRNIPDTEEEFLVDLHDFCERIYDVKSWSDILYSCVGLQRLADALELTRIGVKHQAGSDAMLTSAAFFKIREINGTSYDAHFLSRIVGFSRTMAQICSEPQQNTDQETQPPHSDDQQNNYQAAKQLQPFHPPDHQRNQHPAQQPQLRFYIPADQQRDLQEAPQFQCVYLADYQRNQHAPRQLPPFRPADHQINQYAAQQLPPFHSADHQINQHAAQQPRPFHPAGHQRNQPAAQQPRFYNLADHERNQPAAQQPRFYNPADHERNQPAAQQPRLYNPADHQRNQNAARQSRPVPADQRSNQHTARQSQHVNPKNQKIDNRNDNAKKRQKARGRHPSHHSPGK